MTRKIEFYDRVLILAFVTLCLQFCLGTKVWAQVISLQKGALSGMIADEKQLPLVGATVQLFVAGSDLARFGATTAENGSFQFIGLPQGRYDVQITYVGFGARRYTVFIEADKTSQLDVKMTTEAVVYDEIVVSSGRAREQLSPVTFSNISAEELGRQPDMKDLPVHLARQPSITFHSENGNAVGYSTLRMRGFDQRRLAVSINGLPQNDPEEFNVFWVNFFDIQGAVQDIQIQRGSASSVYGTAAIGGAINIRALPYSPDFKATLQIGGGAFGTRRYSTSVNSGLLNNKYVFFGRLSRLESEGYRDWSWTEFWRYFVGVTRYGDRSTLTLQSYGGPQKDGLAFIGIPKAANDRTVDDGFGGAIHRKSNASSATKDLESFHQPHVEVMHTFDLSSEWQINQKIFWVKGEGYFDFGGTFRSANYLRLPEGFVGNSERGLPLFISRPDVSVLFRAYLDQWQIGWMPRVTRTSQNATTTIALEARLHRSIRWGRIQESSGIPEGLVGSVNDVRVYSFKGEKTIASASVSHLRRFDSLWAVGLDAQFVTMKYRIWNEAFYGTSFEKPYVFVNPRLGVTYRPEHAVSAYASLAFSRREPRLKNLYDGEEAGEGFLPQFEVGSDGRLDTEKPFIKPEHLVDVELGGTWKGQRFKISSNLFLMQFKDELVPSGGLDQYGVPRTGNADKSRHVGIEVDAAVKLTKGLDFAGNFTWSRNRFIQFDEFVTLEDFTTVVIDRSRKTIAGFPAHSGNAIMTYSRRGLVASLMASLVGKQFVDNGNGTDNQGQKNDDLSVESFVLVDATIHYAFEKGSVLDGLSVGLDVNNIMDTKALTFGQVSFGTPEFFPAATRHAFLSLKYGIK